MAWMAVLALSARTRLTVWVSGSRRAKARMRGPLYVGPGLLGNGAALSYPVAEPCEHHVGPVDLGLRKPLTRSAGNPETVRTVGRASLSGEATSLNNGDAQRMNPGPI